MKDKVPTPLSGLLGAVALALALAAPPVALAGEAINLLKDINPGNDQAYGPLGSNPQGFTKAAGAAYFSAVDGSDGFYPHLWRTDGTPEGTVAVPGSPRSPYFLSAVGDTLFFYGCDDGHGCELWKFHPATGCVLAADINSGRGHSFPESLIAFQGTVFFRANDGTSYGLWKMGPSGAELVKRLAQGYYAGPDNLTVMGDRLFFVGQETQDAGRWLWRTSGSPDDVRMVGPSTLRLPPNVAYLTAFDGALFFGANDLSDRHGLELWTSDGNPDSPAGTHRVMDIYPGESLPGGFHNALPGPFAVRDGVLYFTAQSAEGRGLWRTDGTEAGTVLVKNVSPSADSLPEALIPAAGLLFFAADDGVAGREPWRSDGTFDGTFLVEDICNVSEYPHDWLACGPWVVAGTRHDSSGPTGFIAHEEKVYFSAYHPAHGRELFRSDGSTVELVRDFFPGSSYVEYWDQYFPNSSFATPVGEIDRTLYFSADDGVHGLELWTLRSLTPPEEIEGIIETIQGLLDHGTLKPGQGKSLINKLEQALATLEAGDTKKAITMLRAFIHEVQAFRNAGILDPALANDMIATAEAVIASISG